jgi:hypothetical protein
VAVTVNVYRVFVSKRLVNDAAVSVTIPEMAGLDVPSVATHVYVTEEYPPKSEGGVHVTEAEVDEVDEGVATTDKGADGLKRGTAV